MISKFVVAMFSSSFFSNFLAIRLIPSVFFFINLVTPNKFSVIHQMIRRSCWHHHKPVLVRYSLIFSRFQLTKILFLYTPSLFSSRSAISISNYKYHNFVLPFFSFSLFFFFPFTSSKKKEHHTNKCTVTSHLIRVPVSRSFSLFS